MQELHTTENQLFGTVLHHTGSTIVPPKIGFKCLKLDTFLFSKLLLEWHPVTDMSHVFTINTELN